MAKSRSNEIWRQLRDGLPLTVNLAKVAEGSISIIITQGKRTDSARIIVTELRSNDMLETRHFDVDCLDATPSLLLQYLPGSR